MSLTPTQKRYLRGLAHALHPIVMIGQGGLTKPITDELEIALDHHELVKVKLAGADRAERSQQIEDLLEASKAQLVQSIGHTATLYRRNQTEPRLALPR